MTQPAKSDPTTMALIIDLQGLARMEPDDARNFTDAMAQSLTDLRSRNIPITWVTLVPEARLYLPDETGPVATRDKDELLKMGFDGLIPDHRNHDIFSKFLLEHGPQTNEAVCCKLFKSALLEPFDVFCRPDYEAKLERESGMNFMQSFDGSVILPEYMRAKNVQSTLLMGAVSSFCIAETAVSAELKYFSPRIITDRVLSWAENDGTVSPVLSTLAWASVPHVEKIRKGLFEAATDSTRNFHNDLQRQIMDIPLATFDEWAGKRPVTLQPLGPDAVPALDFLFNQ